MTQILRTTQDLPKEAVTFERPVSFDGQGKAIYDSPIPFEANVLEYDAGKAGAEFVTLPDGTLLRTPLTLYVQGDEPDVPNEQDRIELSDGRTFIVAEKKTVSGLWYTRAEPDHYRLRCRAE